MMNTIRSKQIIIISAVLLLIVFLFTRDIKGLVKPKQETAAAVPAGGQLTSSASSINLTEVSTAAKNSINANIAAEITTLENAYNNASGDEQINAAKVLAAKWDDVEQSVPSAMYLEIIANKDKNLNNWLAAGGKFMKAFDTTQDSVISPALLLKANAAYTNAVALDSTNLEAKTGLGITIVNGIGGAPMSGILMLLDVVKKDPKNLKANMSLGTFAIKSGQFDKAITRFKDIIAMKPSPDAYFYLATAYENLGKNEEAVQAYLNSKKLAANPTLSAFIDKKVAELKNKH